MERYPVLSLILKYGKVGSLAAAVLVALIVVALGWQSIGWLSVLLGLIAGGVVFLLARSYVEIVTIITEMLVPH